MSASYRDTEPSPRDFNIDTADGWRLVDESEAGPRAHELSRDLICARLGAQTYYWVREESVPPLPEAVYTVIRVEWKDDRRIGGRVLILLNKWHDLMLGVDVDDLAAQIERFVVLSEPRYDGDDCDEGANGAGVLTINRNALLEEIAEVLDVAKPLGQDWTWAHNISIAVVDRILAMGEQ